VVFTHPERVKGGIDSLHGKVQNFGVWFKCSYLHTNYSDHVGYMFDGGRYGNDGFRSLSNMWISVTTVVMKFLAVIV
jgi:hypothetical protein